MAVRYPRSASLGVKMDQEFHEVPVGQAELKRDGSDALILAIGNRVAPALEAAAVLEKEGISAAVVNARYVKPLDAEMILRLAQRIGNVVTVEENVLRGGFGSQVASLLQHRGLTEINLRSLGIADEFVEAGPQDLLRAKYGLDAAGIAGAVRQILNRKSPVTPR